MESPNDVMLTVMFIFSILLTGSLVVGFLWLGRFGSK